MNKENFSIKNLLVNLTKKQKIGIGLFLVIVAIVAMVFSAMINSVHEDISDESKGDTTEEIDITIGEGTVWSTSGAEDKESTKVETPVSTDYSDSHEYSLIDYVPTSNYKYIVYDGGYGTRNYWWITENTAIEKGIVVSVDSCDVAGNTAAANEYLKSLPVDLSDYIIVYQTHTSDVPCEVQ